MPTGMTSFSSFNSWASSGTHGLPFVAQESGSYETKPLASLQTHTRQRLEVRRLYVLPGSQLDFLMSKLIPSAKGTLLSWKNMIAGM
jgi:hypothetical protein